MKMLTKEELVIENTRLKDKLALYRKINHRQACIIKESLELNKTCQEYALYEPYPYKFEDLKVGMWVWDDVNEDCRQIAEINKYGGIYWRGALTEYEADKFKENRFFPVMKAMHQGKVE